MTTANALIQDQQWVQKARSGHQDAYKNLYERHVEGLFRFLMQFSTDRDQVADWVQQSFTKAFLNLHQYKQQSSFKTWLFGIGVNEMRMSTRRKSHLELVEHFDDTESAENWQPELNQQLRKQIGRLDEQKRMVFLLYEVEGYSHQEIAGIMNLNESTSRTLLTRAKAQLRIWLSGELS